MNKSMKYVIEKLRIGQELFYIKNYNPYKLFHGRITSLNSDERIEVAGPRNIMYVHQLGETVFFSKKKARRVLDHLENIDKLRQAKWDREDKIIAYNRENIKPLIKKYMGRKVRIKVDSEVWCDAKITIIVPTKKPGEYGFRTDYNSFRGSSHNNVYLFKREGKNWEFFSEIKKLKNEKKLLEEKIKKLEEEEKETKL